MPIYMPPIILICIVLVCIVVLLGGISIKLALSAAVLAVVAHVLNTAAQKRKSKRDAATPGTFNANAILSRANIGTRHRPHRHRYQPSQSYQTQYPSQKQNMKPNWQTPLSLANRKRPNAYFPRAITGGGGDKTYKNNIIYNRLNDSRYYCMMTESSAKFRDIVGRYVKNSNHSVPPPKMANTYIVCSDKWEKLADKWLTVVKDEKFRNDCDWADLYSGMAWEQLMARLITRPSLIFYNDNDKHLTASSYLFKHNYEQFKLTDQYGKPTDKAFPPVNAQPGQIQTEIFPLEASYTEYASGKYLGDEIARVHRRIADDNYVAALHEAHLASNKNIPFINTHPSIDDTLSYDEMQLAALLGISSHTRFTGTGVPGETCECTDPAECEHEPDGILVGLTGERFDVPGVMGNRTMYDEFEHKDALDTAVIGHIDDTPGDLPATEICTGCEYYNNPFHDTGEHVANQINGTRFIRRLMIPVRLLLDDAVRRIKTKPFVGRTPYVVATGLGCDKWRPPGYDAGEIELINLYAWISCVFDEKYKDIPLIEYRRQSTHIGGNTKYITPKLISAIAQIITKIHEST